MKFSVTKMLLFISFYAYILYTHVSYIWIEVKRFENGANRGSNCEVEIPVIPPFLKPVISLRVSAEKKNRKKEENEGRQLNRKEVKYYCRQ
jgi:hypothetical protein